MRCAWSVSKQDRSELNRPERLNRIAGTTPVMMAAMYGSEASVKVLMARGADLKRKNDLGLTVADFADRAGRDKLAAQLRAAIGS